MALAGSVRAGTAAIQDAKAALLHRLAPASQDEAMQLTGWEIWALMSVQICSMASKMVMVREFKLAWPHCIAHNFTRSALCQMPFRQGRLDDLGCTQFCYGSLVRSEIFDSEPCLLQVYFFGGPALDHRKIKTRRFSEPCLLSIRVPRPHSRAELAEFTRRPPIDQRYSSLAIQP
eukprot:SAG31_NODE_4098_length_3588_cov_2.607624_4_plen_175_part_00